MGTMIRCPFQPLVSSQDNAWVVQLNTDSAIMGSTFGVVCLIWSCIFTTSTLETYDLTFRQFKWTGLSAQSRRRLPVNTPRLRHLVYIPIYKHLHETLWSLLATHNAYSAWFWKLLPHHGNNRNVSVQTSKEETTQVQYISTSIQLISLSPKLSSAKTTCISFPSIGKIHQLTFM